MATLASKMYHDLGRDYFRSRYSRNFKPCLEQGVTMYQSLDKCTKLAANGNRREIKTQDY